MITKILGAILIILVLLTSSKWTVYLLLAIASLFLIRWIADLYWWVKDRQE